MKIFLIFLFYSICSFSQTSGQTTYLSQIDDALAIKTLAVLPTNDNVNDIYANLVNAELIKLISSDSQWSYVKLSLKESSNGLEAIQDSQKAISWFDHIAADAAVHVNITKGNLGLTVNLSIYFKKYGLPLIQEESRDTKIFESEEILKIINQLYSNAKAHIPFRGMVLSRRGQEVTINMGKSSGLKVHDQVSVVQVVKVELHPKKSFIVSSEKETLGKIELTKVEQNLSFGEIIFERESGVIQPKSKVIPESYISYANPNSIQKNPVSDIAFGKNPNEWHPENPPQYGKVGIYGGFSSYLNSQNLISAGAISAKNEFAPILGVHGEIWLSQDYFMSLGLRQGIITVSNSYPTSTPSSVNMNLNQYGLLFGYNFLLSSNFLGSRLQLAGGYKSTSISAAASTPLAFTTTNYNGLLLSLAGQFPAFENLPINLGASFDLYLTTSLSENTKSGSSNSTKINSFSFFGDYALSVKSHVTAELQFENYSSDFGGSGARSDTATNISNKFTTLSFGYDYLF